MKKLLSTISIVAFLGTLSFTNPHNALAGLEEDKIVQSLFDVAEERSPNIIAARLKVVEEEVRENLPGLLSATLREGRIVGSSHAGKTLLGLLPVPQESSIFSDTSSLSVGAFSITQVNEFDRGRPHLLGISLSFTSPGTPDYLAELELAVAGVVVKSTVTLKIAGIKPTFIGVLAGAIGMTSNDLKIRTEIETNLPPYMRGAMVAAELPRGDISELEERAALASTFEARAREAQRDLEEIRRDFLQQTQRLGGELEELQQARYSVEKELVDVRQERDRLKQQSAAAQEEFTREYNSFLEKTRNLEQRLSQAYAAQREMEERFTQERTSLVEDTMRGKQHYEELAEHRRMAEARQAIAEREQRSLEEQLQMLRRQLEQATEQTRALELRYEEEVIPLRQRLTEMSSASAEIPGTPAALIERLQREYNIAWEKTYTATAETEAALVEDARRIMDVIGYFRKVYGL